MGSRTLGLLCISVAIFISSLLAAGPILLLVVLIGSLSTACAVGGAIVDFRAAKPNLEGPRRQRWLGTIIASVFSVAQIDVLRLCLQRLQECEDSTVSSANLAGLGMAIRLHVEQ